VNGAKVKACVHGLTTGSTVETSIRTTVTVTFTVDATVGSIWARPVAWLDQVVFRQPRMTDVFMSAGGV